MINKNRLFSFLIFSICAVSNLGFADGSPHKFPYYKSSVINLGIMDSGIESEANAINDLGQIAGSFWKEGLTVDSSGKQNVFIEKRNFFIWSETNGLILLDLPESCKIKSLNNSGQIAGINQLENGSERVFIWDSVAGYTDLGTLGGSSASFSGLNDRGQIVGSSLTAEGKRHAFLWDKNVMTDLGVLGTFKSFSEIYENSTARAINNDGTIIGWSSSSERPVTSFVWKEGVMERFRPELTENFGALILEINNNGQVVYLYNVETRVDTIEGDQEPVCIGKQLMAPKYLFNDNGDVVAADRLYLNPLGDNDASVLDLKHELPVGISKIDWYTYPTSFQTYRFYAALEINDFKKDRIAGSGWSPNKGRQAMIWTIHRE